MKTKHHIILIALVGLVVAISLGYFCLVRNVAPTIAFQPTHGYFGDAFGGLNALFSGLAFAVILFTLFYQQEEIRAQNTRMEDQGHRLEAQLKEMKSQSGALLTAANAQRAAVKASLAAMRIEMLKSSIEAEKMAALQWTPGTGQHILHNQQVSRIVAQMREWIDGLESEINKEG